MLRHEDLRRLREAHRDDMVLSVYLSANEIDPANRSAWRLRVAQLLDATRSGLRSPREFDLAAARLEQHLGSLHGFLPGPGWAAFTTTDDILWAGALPAGTADAALWRHGPAFAPSLRSLKQARPIILALVDAERARVFHYEAGHIVETDDLRADTFIDDLSDRGTSKRAATRSGMRGATATDTAKRLHDLAMQRMLHDLATLVERRAGEENLVVIGGSTAAQASLRQRLHDRVGARMIEHGSLRLMMSPAEAKHAIERLASELSSQLQLQAVRDVLEASGPRGGVALGFTDVRRAAHAGQIDRLLLTPGFAREQPDETEVLIGHVLDHGGHVMEIAGEAAARIDAEAGGVAARLRYVRRSANRTAARTSAPLITSTRRRV